MTAHKYLKHTNCERQNCMYCDGGLAFCEVCKGGEAELPTECPGEPMDDATRALVEAGRLDYIDGDWTWTVEA